ncbi:hypothetical protein YPPY72_2025, partial [Yersinia pestis PY-72]
MGKNALCLFKQTVTLKH